MSVQPVLHKDALSGQWRWHRHHLTGMSPGQQEAHLVLLTHDTHDNHLTWWINKPANLWFCNPPQPPHPLQLLATTGSRGFHKSWLWEDVWLAGTSVFVSREMIDSYAEDYVCNRGIPFFKPLTTTNTINIIFGHRSKMTNGEKISALLIYFSSRLFLTLQGRKL